MDRGTIAPRIPGSVGLVVYAGEADRERDRRAVLASFRALPEPPGLVTDGPMTLAWTEGRDRAVHVSGDAICFVEGAVYNLSDLPWVDNDNRNLASSVASAYARLGERVLDDLRGDFWLLLWQREIERGIVACDQMGGWAPYWAAMNGRIVFGSELADVVATLPRRPDPDHAAMAHWLALTVAPEGRSLFSGVRRLEAGHLLPLGSGLREPRRYWLPAYHAPLKATRAEVVDLLRTSLDQSAHRRLGDTSRAALLLSGGLDSSALAAISAGKLRDGQRLDAYSATFPDYPTIDESSLIDTTTAALGLRSTRLVVRGGSIIGGAIPYLETWGVPPTSPNLFFWNRLLERAHVDGVDVLFAGEGGDELFGLSPYLIADRLLRGRVLSAIDLARRIPGVRPDSAERIWRMIRLFGLKGMMPAAAHRVARRARGAQRYTPNWMRSETAQVWLDSDPASPWKSLAGPRWWSFLVEAVILGIGPALVYEQSRRRAAMAGLRARHPLVDVDVVELALRLPPDLAFDARFSRPLLRDAIVREIPDQVRLRPAKSNFDAIFHAALAGPDLPLVRAILDAPDARIGAYVDLTAVRRELLGADLGGRRWAIAIWRLVTAECWLRAQEDAAFLTGVAQRNSSSAANGEFVVVANRTTV